jgi:hypothetical protein
MADKEEGMGAGFWLGLVGICVAVGVIALLIFAFIGAAWYAWGLVGTFVVVGAVLLAIGWLIDRREARRYERLPG